MTSAWRRWRQSHEHGCGAARTGSPREMSGPVLGMVLFVASEAMFFAAFFGGYFTIRANAKEWPPAGIPTSRSPSPRSSR